MVRFVTCETRSLIFASSPRAASGLAIFQWSPSRWSSISPGGVLDRELVHVRGGEVGHAVVAPGVHVLLQELFQLVVDDEHLALPATCR